MEVLFLESWITVWFKWQGVFYQGIFHFWFCSGERRFVCEAIYFCNNFREVGLKMEQELYLIYKCLEGKQFQATYKGEFRMETGKERSVFEIVDSDLEAILE